MRGRSRSCVGVRAASPTAHGCELSNSRLGSDAEDILRDAWLRWSTTDAAQVTNPEAFLTTVVSRLSLDRLRRVKARREVYQGPWLPEPVTAETDPQAAAALAYSLSLAFLVILGVPVAPLERAAFVLREVFDEPYATVADILGRDEPAVRQLVPPGPTTSRRGRRPLSELIGLCRLKSSVSSSSPASPPTSTASWRFWPLMWCSSATAAAWPPLRLGRSMDATRWPGC